MTEQNNQIEDDGYNYYPEIDQIFINAEIRLREIENWDNFKNLADQLYFNKNPKLNLPPINLRGWSKEFFYVIWFDELIKEDTDLFNDEIPDGTEEPDPKKFASCEIQDYETSYKLAIERSEDWLKKLIKIAPKALNE